MKKGEKESLRQMPVRHSNTVTVTLLAPGQGHDRQDDDARPLRSARHPAISYASFYYCVLYRVGCPALSRITVTLEPEFVSVRRQ